MVLAPVTLPELGRFLSSWEFLEPAWTVSTIDLAPIAHGNASPGGDLPIRAVMSIESHGDAPLGNSP